MEAILVVPRTLLFGGMLLYGFSSDRDLVLAFLARVAASGRFAPRDRVEHDEAWKQIVPYGVVWAGEQLFLFRRGRAGREAGLRGCWSIGLGGHVNPEDGEQIGAEMLERALLRELAEEVCLDMPLPELWGVLNDDTDPVGRRHFGFVYRVRVASGKSTLQERSKVQGGFRPLGEVWARAEGMESWSRWILEALRREDANPGPG
ncbi:MAG: NUDIX domain-containing protein [Chloroflexia bacterium]